MDNFRQPPPLLPEIIHRLSLVRKKSGCQVQKKCECCIKFEINWFPMVPFLKWHTHLLVKWWIFLKIHWIISVGFFPQILLHSTLLHLPPPQNLERVYLVSSSGSWLLDQVLTLNQLYTYCEVFNVVVSGVRLGCESWLVHSLVMWSWARYLLLWASFSTCGNLDS